MFRLIFNTPSKACEGSLTLFYQTAEDCLHDMLTPEWLKISTVKQNHGGAAWISANTPSLGPSGPGVKLKTPGLIFQPNHHKTSGFLTS